MPRLFIAASTAALRGEFPTTDTEMRAVWILALVACASGPPYRISIRDQYEVGEDPLIGVAIRETREDNAVLIVTRPDGSTVAKKVTLAADHTTVRFGGDPERGEPTF